MQQARLPISGEPLHQQLKHVILRNIREGAWPPNSQIASERELCERHSVSRTTTRRAITDLVHEGVLYTVGGKGTFVSERPLRQELKPLVGFAQDLQAQSIEVTSEVLDFRRIEADAELAERLQIRPLWPVIRLQRRRFAAGQPVAIQTAFLPEHLCPGLLQFDFAKLSLYETLRKEYGLVFVEGRTTIKAALANDSEGELLSMPLPTAVLRTVQHTILADGQVIEYCESSFHGDHFQLTSSASAERRMEYDAPASVPTRQN